jgi:Predicted ATPase
MSERRDVFEFGPFRLHMEGRLLERNGVEVKIGSRSLDLLFALVERPGEVLSQRELISHAWSGLTVDEANVRVNIASLRKSLGHGEGARRYIVNVPGRGYSFVAQVTRTTTDATSPINPGPASLRPVLDPANSLPQRLSRLIGREAAGKTLVQLLIKHRFVSIIGPGGMGKTSVAISVAHTMVDDFHGAVYYVDLAAAPDASGIPSLIASVLGLKMGPQDLKASILAFLGGRKALFVFDNCEHLIGDIAALAEWIYTSAPQAHLLATSREWLRSEGEHVYILPPLDVPLVSDGLTRSEAMASSAVQLFLDRALAGGLQTAWTYEMVSIAVEICRRMDGIPLAIELAAGRARTHGLRGTAELIDSRFKLLWQGRRTAPPRHQTLHAMLDWSYDLLSECERRVLYRLSIFVGPFELAAAQWVAADASLTEAEVSAAISSLIDKSLLCPSILDGWSYLRLLDVTRTYAAQKLAESGEGNSISQKLAEYLVEQLSQDEERSDDASGISNRVSLQVGNIRIGLAYAFSEAGDGDLGVRLAAHAASHFLRLSLYDECHRWCRIALAQLTSYEGSRTHLLLQEAEAMSALYTRVDRDSLRDSIRIGLSLARTLDDHQGELSLLAAQHIVLCHMGNFVEAVDVSLRSLELAQRAARPDGIVMSEWMLACAYHFLGDQAGALRHCKQGFKTGFANGTMNVDLHGFAHRTRALNVLARALWLSGAVDHAAQVARQAVEESEQDEQPMSKLVALTYSATVLLWRGDLEESEVLLSRLMQHVDRYNYGQNPAFAIALSGEVALLRGEFGTAAVKLREAVRTLRTEKRDNLTTQLEGSLAAALFRCGEILEADAVITAAVDRADGKTRSFTLPELMRMDAEIGIVSRRLDSSAAEVMLRHAMRLAKRQHARSFELRSAMSLGELLAREGRTEEAFATLAKVYGSFTEGSQTRDIRAARSLLEAWAPSATIEG